MVMSLLSADPLPRSSLNDEIICICVRVFLETSPEKSFDTNRTTRASQVEMTKAGLSPRSKNPRPPKDTSPSRIFSAATLRLVVGVTRELALHVARNRSHRSTGTQCQEAMEWRSKGVSCSGAPATHITCPKFPSKLAALTILALTIYAVHRTTTPLFVLSIPKWYDLRRSSRPTDLPVPRPAIMFQGAVHRQLNREQ